MWLDKLSQFQSFLQALNIFPKNLKEVYHVLCFF